MKYYDPINSRLVFLGNKATPEFWDQQWNLENLKEVIKMNGSNDKFVSKITKKFLQPNKSVKILEGGCGMGHFVYSLNRAGFEAYGIDFAPETIAKLKEMFPDMNFSLGDVRKIDFPDNFFDAYWSLGVIEHFYEGYKKAADEMKRVIKNGGYLFITFPYLSKLRKLKIFLKRYPIFNSENFNRDLFYQFAFNRNKVIEYFKNLGFKLIYQKSLDGVNGLREEIFFSKSFMDEVYRSRKFLFKALRFIFNKLFSGFSGHIILLVFKK